MTKKTRLDKDVYMQNNLMGAEHYNTVVCFPMLFWTAVLYYMFTFIVTALEIDELKYMFYSTLLDKALSKEYL